MRIVEPKECLGILLATFYIPTCGRETLQFSSRAHDKRIHKIRGGHDLANLKSSEVNKKHITGWLYLVI